MKGILILGLAVVFVMSLGTAALAQQGQQQPNKQPTASQRDATSGEMPSVSESRLVTETATVEAINQKDRTVTLKGPEGKTVEVKVGPNVKNFSQIKVGDQVTARYYESIAVDIRRPGEPGPSMGERRAMGRAKPGEKPAGYAADQTTITATVTAIAPDKSHVTLKGPEGKTKEIKVRDPKNIQNVKVGDQIRVTYTEAVAVSVDKARA